MQRRYGKALLATLFLTGCGIAPQPQGLETVAAYEVPLPAAADKAKFLTILRAEATREGFHVDAATPAQMEAQSELSPITFNAAVWRGDDEEVIASAMDFRDTIGRIWITFAKGQDPVRSARFRNAIIPRIKRIWPRTLSLPIMPNGGIPLVDDLVRTPSGYKVNPAAASKYERTGQDRHLPNIQSDLLHERHSGEGRNLPVMARHVSRERPRPSPG